MSSGRTPSRLAAALGLLALVTAVAPAVSAAAWSPDPPRYRVGVERNVPVTMRDGTVLRADIYRPVDAQTGRRAEGRFPVILTQTPYTKTRLAAVGETESGEYPDPGYFVPRGYLMVFADVRGTGGSGGTWEFFGPEERRDGPALVRWAAALPNANGKVGLLGPSYMGINQFFTAAAVGRRSPLKAIFPIVAANDAYREMAVAGGIPNGESGPGYLAFTGGLNTAGPVIENPTEVADALDTSLQHLAGTVDINLGLLLHSLTDGDRAYDGAWWRARAPGRVLDDVVRNRIPAFLVGGWFDAFQRGAPLNYAGLQNAWAGRPVGAPMRRRQRTSGRYQLLMGPWYHLDVGEHLGLKPIQLRWFDTWLKGRRTGITNTRTPLHLYQFSSGRWFDLARYPVERARPTTYYLGAGSSGSAPHSRNDGTLSTTPPSAARGADEVAFTASSSPCSLQTSQWSLGVYRNELCEHDDRSIQSGAGALTYTTAALPEAIVLAGPVGATLYATSTRPDVQWVVTIEDVAPDGTSTPLSSGALIGSQRAMDRKRTWWSPEGRALLPYHPLTRSSKAPVPTGQVTRFEIEVPPTFALLAKAHRLRVTIGTSDTPHLLPTPTQLADLTGGVYQLQRNTAAASSVELPLAAATAYDNACELCQ